MAEPIWLKQARKYVGLREVPGKQHNKTILGWWDRLKTGIRDDETPWCGAFVGGVLSEVGGSIVAGPAAARSWLKLPTKLDKPALGCVVVFWRGSPKGWSGHVGFVAGKDTRGNIMVLGGNQGDMVSIRAFAPNRVLGYRWPSTSVPVPSETLPLYRAGKVSTNEA